MDMYHRKSRRQQYGDENILQHYTLDGFHEIASELAMHKERLSESAISMKSSP